MAAGRRTLRLPVPTHVITGGLASGKTSLILHLLLTQKPEEEVWAVLVNEMGAVGIDQAVLAAAGGAVVRELAGGCLCCAMSHVTGAALVQLLRSAKPDRLIIEPSGLAHPSALLDLLRGPHLASALAIQPVTCLVDLTRFGDAPDGNLDQVALADIVVGSKADACSAAAAAAFRTWAALLRPPRHVLTCSNAELSAKALGFKLRGDADKRNTAGLAAPLPPAARPKTQGAPASPWAETDAASTIQALGPGRPLLKQGQRVAGGAATCGWIFHSEDIFTRQRTLDFLEAAAPHVLRVKGIVRVAEREWVSVSVGSGPQAAVSCTPTDHTDDSRLEIICAAAGGEGPARSGTGGTGGGVAEGDAHLAAALRRHDWAAVERVLVGLLEPA